MEKNETFILKLYKYRKIFLNIAASCSISSALLFFVLNFIIVTKTDVNGSFFSWPFINETVKQLQLLNNFNLIINLINVIITFFALYMIIKGKKRGVLLYSLTRVILLLNITFFNSTIRLSLSTYTHIVIAIILSIWMILLYSYLIRKKKISIDLAAENESNQTQST